MTNPNDSIHIYSNRAGYGLTKREHFSALILQGLIAHESGLFGREFNNKDVQPLWKDSDYAEAAVDLADELINVLNKKKD